MTLATRCCVLVALAAAPTLAIADNPGSITTDSFRCGDELVQVGDTQQSLQQKCGDPTENLGDHWRYQRGPDVFSVVLYFEPDGTIAQIIEQPLEPPPAQ